MNLKKNLEKNKDIIKKGSISVATAFLLTLIVGILSYILNCSVAEIIRNTITFLWGCFVIVFLWYQSSIQNNLEYDNKYHPIRFLVVFIICFFVSMGMVFAPTSTWVFLSIMVVLSMFSNPIIGLTSGNLLLLITASLSSSSTMYVFFLYFMVGLLGISFFRNLDLDFQVAGPMVLSGIASFVLQGAYIVIFENQPISFVSLFIISTM